MTLAKAFVNRKCENLIWNFSDYNKGGKLILHCWFSNWKRVWYIDRG